MLSLLVSTASEGQRQEVDVVYLKSGEVYRGKIQDHLDAEEIRLQTLCLDTRLFRLDEVSRIEMERMNLPGWLPGFHKPSKGYFNRTDLGVLIGSGSNENNAILSIQMVNGYRFGSRYFPGIGTGIEFFNHTVVPVFADFTYRLDRDRVSPMFRAGFGYSISVEDPPDQWGARTDYRGGCMGAAGIGTTIRTGISSALAISLVYRYQSIKSVYTEDWNDTELELEQHYYRIALRIGFIFD